MDVNKQLLLAQLHKSISSIEQLSDEKELRNQKAGKKVRNASRKNGSFGGCFSGNLPEEQPLSFSNEFDAEDDSAKAFKKICDLIRVRDRSVYEVRKRLKDSDFSEQGIEEAVQKALRCNYLNDRRFAGVYVRSKYNQAKGASGIRRELKNHCISDAVIEEIFAENIPEDSEEDRALNYLRRKPSHSKNPFQSAYAKLIRRGFSSAVASAAAKKWFSEQR